MEAPYYKAVIAARTRDLSQRKKSTRPIQIMTGRIVMAAVRYLFDKADEEGVESIRGCMVLIAGPVEAHTLVITHRAAPYRESTDLELIRTVISFPTDSPAVRPIHKDEIMVDLNKQTGSEAIQHPTACFNLA